MKLLLVVSLLIPVVASADDFVPKPERTAPIASWTPVQQWEVSWSDYDYGDYSGMLLLADELGDHLSELGRARLIDSCIRGDKVDIQTVFAWAMCGPDVKALDLKKLEAELSTEKVPGAAKAEILKGLAEDVSKLNKLGAAIEAEAKTDPGIKAMLKLTETAKAEWTAYLAKNKADFDRYVALKDAVRSGKSNNPAFQGCFEATLPSFTKLVKAVAPKIPWDVGNDYVPGYMSYLTASTEGYIATTAWAACAWSIDESGKTPFSGAAAQDTSNNLHAGFRTIALGKALDEKFEPKFADRSMSLRDATYSWKSGVKPPGTSVVAPIVTRNEGTIGKLTPKDDMTVVAFKGDKVEACLQWKETNKVAQVTNGNVSYEKKCMKRGMVENQVGESEVPSKYMTGAKVGDSFAEVNKFPVVAWKGNKLTMLFGVPLK